jgi:hypothetical protein
MLCFSPNVTLSDEIFIFFGETKVSANCIQPGVLKCQVPRHDAGIVTLKIFLNGTFIEDTNLFEYKKEKKGGKKNEKLTETVFDKADAKKMNQNFKVRIIERLSSLCNDNKNFAGKLPSDKSKNLMNAFEKEDVPKILEIYLQELDSFDLNAFLNVLALISKQKNNVGENINSLDEDGFALVHYISLISLLLI